MFRAPAVSGIVRSSSSISSLVEKIAERDFVTEQGDENTAAAHLLWPRGETGFPSRAGFFDTHLPTSWFLLTVHEHFLATDSARMKRSARE